MEQSDSRQRAGQVARTSRDADQEPAGKIKLLSRETRGLVEDIKAWVELRMTLAQMDVEEKVDARINRAMVGAIVGALAFLGLTFALIAAALGLGTLFGHSAWGFLTVAGVLIIITVVLLAAKPRIVKVSSGRARPQNANE